MITGAAALVALIAVAGIAGVSYAYQGNPNLQGPNYSSERHEAMETALEEENYQAWQELMGDRGRVAEVVTEDNFAKFAEAHQLAKQGDLEGARAIREELGLNQGSRKGGLNKKGRGMDSETRGAIRQALENNDYEAWKNLKPDRPCAEELSQEDFAELVEAHNLRQEGNFEEAREIQQELGLGKGMSGGMMMKGKGMNGQGGGCGSCLEFQN